MRIWSRGFRSFPRRLAPSLMAALRLVALSDPASAYRPFDGTDAAVAKKGEMEIELQPAGRLRDEMPCWSCSIVVRDAFPQSIVSRACLSFFHEVVPMRPHLPPLNTLKVFEAAARHESFTRAAEELCVT